MGIGIGDVTTVYLTLMALGIVFPGLLLALSLLLPDTVARAQERAARTPGKSFVFGAFVLLITGVPIVFLFSHPGPLQMLGYIGTFLLIAVTYIGAAGISALMGERLRGAGIQASSPGALLRGAVALEFAMIFPIIGWFIILPIIAILSLGVAAFALLHWTPSESRGVTHVVPISTTAIPAK